MQIEENISLKELNWLKAGGVAQFFAAPRTPEELRECWHWAWQNRHRVHVISGGSNVLIADGLLVGLTICLHHMKGIVSTQVLSGAGDSSTTATGLSSVDSRIPETAATSAPDLSTPAAGEIQIRCLAGTPKSDIAKIFLQNRLAPAVFITGIPGDIGAGVVMNAGIGEQRTPREFCEIVKRVTVLRIDEVTGEFSEHEILGRDIRWEYRHSSGWQPGIITHVTLACANTPDAQVSNGVREQTRKRVATQPLDLPNCGSVFRNPAGHKSAQLIESCGLKGYRIGGASVSTKHANFVVNDQGATAKDIREIIEHVRSTVFSKTGVQLKPEVVFIGD